MDFIQATERHLFFTGKGGVGKTSTACATAIALADRGRRVLLVSTDPASNLDEVLGVAVSPQPTAISAVPGLFALNLDPEEAAREYRERVVGPYRGVLPQAAVASIEEQLAGACTVEIAAFDEFSKLLGDPARSAGARRDADRAPGVAAQRGAARAVRACRHRRTTQPRGERGTRGERWQGGTQCGGRNRRGAFSGCASDRHCTLGTRRHHGNGQGWRWQDH